MDNTPNLNLPYILAAQAQKHVTHNEAIRALDAVVQISVADRDLTAPPGSPAEGDRYIVAAGATGDWSGNDTNVAAWQDGAWMFYAPREGWLAWVGDEDVLVAWDGTAWVTAGITDQVPLLGINAVADTTNRLALSSAASLFNHAGAGHQQKINKNAAGDTASILFQTGFSGRAEFGTTGDDDWHVKVSPDGSTWHEALVADKDTGEISLGAHLKLAGNRTVFDADADTYTSSPADDVLQTYLGGAIVQTLTGSSLVVRHTGSVPGVNSLHPGIQNHALSSADCTFAQYHWNNGSFGGSNWILKSRNGTVGGHTILQDGDIVGQFGFAASDGSAFIPLGVMRGVVEGAPGTGDMPGALTWAVSLDGGAALTERLRLSNNGVLTSQASYDNTVSGSALEVTSAGVIGRTSSSIAGKTALEEMDAGIALSAVKAVRARFFRRKEPGGDMEPGWSQYGFIAEEMAAVDPRFARHALYREELDAVEVEPGRVENRRRVVKRDEPVVQDIDRDAILAAAWTVLGALTQRIEALEAKR